MPSKSLTPRGMIGLLIVVQLLLAIVVIGGVLHHVLQMRDGALEAQRAELASVTHRVEEQLTQTFSLIGLTLASLDELSGLTSDEDWRLVEQRLQKIKGQMPAFRSLSFADANGRIMVSSVPPNVGQRVDLGSLLPHAPVARVGLLRIGVPWEGRDFASAREVTESSPAQWQASTFIPVALSLAVGKTGGEFVVALAAVNPDFFLNRMPVSAEEAGIDVAVVNYQGITLLSNQRALLHGSRMPDEALLTRAIGAFAEQVLDHPADDEPVVLASRTSRTYPLVVIAKQPHRLVLASWWTDARRLLFVAGGALLLTLGTTAYLTRRIAVAQARESRYQESQRLAARLFERSNDSAIITDGSTRILAVNPAFERITGYTAAEVLSQTPGLLSSGQHDKDFYHRMWATVLAENEWHGEITNRCKNGVLVSGWMSILSLRDAEGMIFGYIGLFRDLSEIKRSEQTIRQLSTAVEQSTSSIVITTLEPAIEYVNPAFCKITGYQPHEVIGQNPRILKSNLTPEHVYPEMWARLEAGDTWQGEFINKRKDGSFYHEFATLSPVRDETGSIVRYLAIKYDITDRVRLEHDLISAKEAAEAANRSKSEFLANMSHEIRTPLNAVIGLSELLLQEGLTAAARSRAEQIHRSGELLLGIVNDLLDFSRIEAGRMEAESVPFRLQEIICHLETLFSEPCRRKGLSLVLRLQPGVPECCAGDILRLTQVLANLLANAIKFTEHGSVSLDIGLQRQVEGRARLSFCVRDTGIGMSDEQQGRLFQAFSQADTSITRRHGGTGLGLVISRRLVQLMGGDGIGLQSELGVGSAFSFELELPLAESPPPLPDGPVSQLLRTEVVASASASKLRVPAVRRARFRGQQVLVVDDHPVNQQVVQAQLEQLGLQVTLADDGAQAVEKVREHPFDVVLMDIQMPVMDGYEATREIRRFNPDIPIIALTAAAMVEDRDCALKAGMNDHLGKPFSGQQLFEHLERWLETEVLSACDWDAKSAASIKVADRRTVLIVDDQSTNIKMLASLLKSDYTIQVASGGARALEIARNEPRPDLILLDILMPDMDGHAVCRALKDSPATSSIPVIFISSLDEASDETRGLDLGASDYISKPFHPEIVRARVRNHMSLKIKTDMLEAMSHLDGLTQIANRRRLDLTLASELRRLARNGKPLGVVMLDIDYFKPFNDHYGHGRGDDCLVQVATALQRVIQRPGDLLARYGGEEFAVILPETDHDGVGRIAEAMRAAVEALAYPHAFSEVSEHVTISVGAMFVPEIKDETAEYILARADAALYDAKEQGRNRVVIAGARN